MVALGGKRHCVFESAVFRGAVASAFNSKALPGHAETSQDSKKYDRHL